MRNKFSYIISALNFDGVSFRQDLSKEPFRLHTSADSLPFVSDVLLKIMVKEYFSQELPLLKWEIKKNDFSDDTFMNDSMIGISTNWLWQSSGKYWHTNQNTFDKVDIDLYRFIMEIGSTYAYFMASCSNKELKWLIAETQEEAKRLFIDEKKRFLTDIISQNDSSPAKIKEQFIKKISYTGSVEKERLKSVIKLAEGSKELNNSIKKAVNSIKSFANKTILNNKNIFLPKPFQENGLDRTAWNIIPKRRMMGFPHCQAKIPHDRQRNLSKYIKHVLAWMDGKSDLQKILEKVKMELDIELSDKEKQSIISDCFFLKKYGYIDIRYKISLDKDKIKQAIKKIGIKHGNILLVHSSLSALGYIKGGPDTIIDSFLEVLGSKGTLCMPAFTYSTVNAKAPFIPYDPKKTTVRTGKISDTFWRRKGVLRSKHPSHGLAAIGPEARSILKGNERYSPYAKEGAFGKLYDLDAKIILFGCEFSSNSIVHCLEDWANLPSMEPDDYLIVDNKGEEKKVRYLKEPRGHREFTMKGKVSKIEKLLRKKNVIKETNLGLGKIILMKTKDVMNIGLDAIKKNPDILYCDDPKKNPHPYPLPSPSPISGEGGGEVRERIKVREKRRDTV